MKIAITTSSFAKFSDAPLQLLRDAGIEYVLNPHGRKLTEEETIEVLQGCVGVAAGTEPLTERVMAALPELKAISRCGTGMDNVDHAAAKARGIAVRNTPDGPTLAVAELTLGYALDLMRKVTQQDRELRSGVWKKRMGNTLKGKKLGIIGFGRIGQAVASVFAPLGVEIAFNDPVATSDAYASKSVDDLLSWADILTLHCSKTGGECSLFTTERLMQMKKGSWVINASRGGIIEEDALYELCKSGHLSGAAIDVFDKEPYDGPLKELDSVILTPHIGSYAMESRIQMETDTILNLLDALRG
ncbi:phosphoglycerate dehydrogenase [Desulfovibrio psychrotolerans]|uniref:2-hydroxyacid dehydrogenase n=1 Tax=Desulfovibrio psychrotolerans TaxID=415242 RepID=A0A7J0BWM7_9BACT|nr:phosphoglycerate dehydrogenase [Desulfovibrio psychrotolerans]GFM38126.1 2-hydroxyacid dehydrogenase [Desulfovibrio psychrotolerans]